MIQIAIWKQRVMWLDRKCFGNIVRKIYHKSKDWIQWRQGFFHGKKSVLLKEPVADMLLMQTDRNENHFDQYCAYDLAVRCLSIENYYGENNFGFEFYKRMHVLGGNYGQNNDVERYYERIRRKKRTPNFGNNGYLEQHSVEQFKMLLKSIDEDGFKGDSCVMNDRNLLSMNGSHRLAIAFYKQMEYLNVEVHDCLFQRRFTIDYFWKKRFSYKEINVINAKMKSILDECRKRIGGFYCILFPPAEKYFDEITEDIRHMEEKNISVTDYQDYEWEVSDLKGFLRSIYYFDSILPVNLERKLYYIFRSSQICQNRVRFRIIIMDIKHPMYRLKKDSGMPESMAMVRLKEMVRERYRVREKKFTEHYVGDYAHDVIIHSSDNYISNHAFRDILAINRDLSCIVEGLNEFEYALLSSSTDKVSESFPENFYIGEDFDILVKEKDLENIAQKICNICNVVFYDTKIEIGLKNSTLGKQICLTYCDFMITMFDFIIELPGIKREYIQKFIKEREPEIRNNKRFYKLSLINELIYRTSAFVRNPLKIYHREYLCVHKNEVQVQQILDAFDKSIYKKADKLLKEIIHSRK